MPLEIWIAILGGLFVVILSSFSGTKRKGEDDDQGQG